MENFRIFWVNKSKLITTMEVKGTFEDAKEAAILTVQYKYNPNPNHRGFLPLLLFCGKDGIWRDWYGRPRPSNSPSFDHGQEWCETTFTTAHSKSPHH